LQIDSPFEMNDWGISKFLKTIMGIQVITLFFITLNQVGLGVPPLVLIFGIIYIAILPGIVLLRVLRLHKLGAVKTLLYSVALSLGFQMFLGFLLNEIGPLVGVSEPISILPLISASFILVTSLGLLSYLRDKNFVNPKKICLNREWLFPAFTLCILPFLSVLGATLMNLYSSNTLTLILLIILSAVPVLVVFNLIPKRTYPIAILTISISLLFYSSLISSHLLGWDINVEYYFAELVKTNSYWNLTLPLSYNAMLSITMVGPIFSNICSLSIVWVFKIIYPLIFSLVPLVLFKTFQEQTDDKIAFLSCFFFMASYVFFSNMIQLARQEIASLFLALLILLMIDKKLEGKKRAFLFITFGFMLVVSHYSLFFVYAFFFVTILIIQTILNSKSIRMLGNRFFIGLHKSPPRLPIFEVDFIRPIFFLPIAVFALIWYTLVSGSIIINQILEFLSRIANNILINLFNAKSVQGLNLLVTETYSPLHAVNKILYLLFEGSIIIGVVFSFLRYRNLRFRKEYLLFSISGLIIVFASLSVPYFSSALGSDRLYHITLFILAPFCVIGFIAFFEGLNKVLSRKIGELRINSLKIISILLAAFLLFNSGFVYEIAKDNSASISLNNTHDYPRFNDGEVQGAEWVTSKSGNSTIYGDTYGRLLLYEFAFWRVNVFWGETGKLPENVYVYLRSLNGKGTVMESESASTNVYTYLPTSQFYNESLSIKNKIYDNGFAQVYL
jgi:uncharacterized membrane protein